MSSFFGKIKEKFRFGKNKKNKLLVVLFFVFVFSGILTAGYALAWGWPTTEEISMGIASIITWMLLLIAQFFIKLTVWASQLFIVIASYNNFINSQAVILGWVLVRDVVNMFFVLILLVIAFGTVLGIEQYEWKKLLVKLVFAAVLVNFSRVICGVIIDVSQVFMMTFVNGFAATAGGNVIKGLNLDTIYNLSPDQELAQKAASATDVFVTGVAAVFFSVISFFVIGAYLLVVIARVVALWTLIVLSPIAFMSSVLPNTQKYASEWWKEFNNHVMAGPILAFFFWLSFAIVGGGDSFNEVLPTDQAKRYETNALFGSTATGISQAMEWGKMASFAIAIALLITGVKKTQELGVTGASALSSAMSTAKKIATVATGVRLAGWAGEKAKGAALGITKGIAMNAPGIGGYAWMNRYEGAKTGLKRFTARSLREGGFVGEMYNRSVKNERLNKQLKGENEAWDSVLDDLSGTKANWNQKNQNERVKAYAELLKRRKEAGGIGVKENAQAWVETEAPGIMEETLAKELEGTQAGGLKQAREDRIKDQMAKLKMGEAGYVERQKELERLKSESEDYKKFTAAQQEKIAAEEKLRSESRFRTMKEETVKTKLETQQLKEEVGSRESIRELKKIEELLKQDKKFREKQNEVYRQQASAETLKMIVEDEKKLEIAKAKDEQAEKRFIPKTNEAAYWAELQSGREKSFGNLQYAELVAMSAQNANKVIELDKNKAAMPKESYERERKALLSNQAAMESVAAKNFGSDGIAAVQKSINEAYGIKYDKLDSGDAFAHQLVETARMAGEKIDLQDILDSKKVSAETDKDIEEKYGPLKDEDYDQAFAEEYGKTRDRMLLDETKKMFKIGQEKMGAESWQTVLRNNDISARAAAPSGFSHTVSIYDGTSLGKNGLAEYKLQTNKNKILEGQKYFTGPLSNKVGDLESLSGIASINSSGEMVGLDEHAQNMIIQTLRNFTFQGRIHGRLSTELLNLLDSKTGSFKNLDLGKDFVNTFEKMIENNSRSAQAVLSKIPKEVAQALSKSSEKIADAVKKGVEQGAKQQGKNKK
ncbi:MAG TPA: hypothetical protein P5230_01380 [Candidatus Magasanikbacteria bacterium]|nr:hypothetical protein [Candidatus Magasanikbacteria bacterium]